MIRMDKSTGQKGMRRKDFSCNSINTVERDTFKEKSALIDVKMDTFKELSELSMFNMLREELLTLMCSSIGTPKSNKFSICSKWEINYF